MAGEDIVTKAYLKEVVARLRAKQEKALADAEARIMAAVSKAGAEAPAGASDDDEIDNIVG